MKLGDLLSPQQYVLEILEGIESVEGNLPEDGNDVEEALAIAKRAVEKQIGVKPLENIVGFYCPKCKRFVESVYNYCGFCGQKIDWECE